MTYTVEGKPRTITYADQTVKDLTAETVTFPTAMHLLRWALDTRIFAHRVGGRPYPTRPTNIWLGSTDDDRGYDYHLVDTFCDYKITSEHMAAMRRARRRYAEIVHHLREVDPDWVPDTSVSASGEVHYADNSVELYEVSRTYPDQRRSRQLLAPSGDACF